MKSVKTLFASLASAALLVAAVCFSGPGPTSVEAASASPVLAYGPALVVAQDGAFGTIKGRLVWGGPSVPTQVELKVEKDPQICAKSKLYDRGLVVDPDTKGIAHAFAYVVSPKGKNPAAEKALLAKMPKVEIDNLNCEFQPYSTAAHKAQGFVFKSSDPIGHNAHYTGFTNNKNVALPPSGKTEDKLVAEKRPIALKCDIHPWMKGWIMVFDHPFFAVTAPDGSFTIDGVPAGPQSVIVWQEKAGYVTEGAAKGKTVQVESGKTVDLGDIVLSPTKVK